MSTSGHWETLAALPLRVESYELSGHDREYEAFTRPSTVIHLRGDGEEGQGEDVVYDVLDQIAHRDAGTPLDLTGPSTLGEFCELIGGTRPLPGRGTRDGGLAPLPPLGV